MEEQVDQMISRLKLIKSSLKKKQKLSDKLFETNPSDVTPKRYDRMNADLNFHCMALEKEITQFARMFNESELNVDIGEKEYRPSGFQTYKD